MNMKKVLVIDDSAYARQTLKGLIAAMDGVDEVHTAIDGVDGYSQALRTCPDAILLDLEMPNMDGFTFLRLFRGRWHAPVIVLSSMRWKDFARRALSLGAFDYIEKPVRGEALDGLRGELERKLRVLPFTPVGEEKPATGPALNTGVAGPAASEAGAVVIGASTGGPGAVSRIIRSLPSTYPFPVAVAMHIPGWLAGPYAQRLGAEARLAVSVAADAEPVAAGTVLVAPGGYHLGFTRWKGRVYTRLSRRSPSDLYAPSVDMLFSSAADVWGPGVTGVVLSGMGADGTEGAVRIKEMGGFVMAQSRESAAAPGMPASVVAAGAADAVLSPGSIGAMLSSRAEAEDQPPA